MVDAWTVCDKRACKALSGGGPNDLYRRLVESAREFAMFSMTLDGRVQSWNSGGTLLFGYEPDEIIGLSASIIFTPEDILIRQDMYEFETALRDGRVLDERWHIRKDGSRFWASGLMMTLTADDGTVDGLIKIVHDRTEARLAQLALQRSEERMRLILDSATDYAIFTLDMAGRVVTWNPGAERLLGYDEDEIMGADARVFHLPEDAQTGIIEDEFLSARRDGRATTERWHLRKGGSRFWGSGLTMPLRDEGTITGYLKIMRDQTEAHRAMELQDVLMREVSHRVKNSLALVTSLLGLQARASRDARVAEAIDDARRRIGTVAEVHDQLWRQADVRSVDLASFLTSLCARLEGTSDEHRIALSVVPLSIGADRAVNLGLIVNELVVNAMRHAFAGGKGIVSITVTTQPDGAFLRLVLEDDGVGLPVGFEMDAPTRDSLGMRVVLGLVRQLGGDITVSPRHGGGTCFTLTVPSEPPTP